VERTAAAAIRGSIFIGRLHVESAQQAAPFQKVPRVLCRQPERDAAIKNR